MMSTIKKHIMAVWQQLPSFQIRQANYAKQV